MFLLISLATVMPPPPDAVIRSVAFIRADPDGVGTGFLLAGVPPRVITCRHVLGDRKTADVYFPRVNELGAVDSDRAELLANRELYKQSGHLVIGKRIASSDDLDLAVLELPSVPSGVTGLSLSPYSPSAGSPIWSVGCRGDQATLWNVSRGLVRQVGPLRDGYSWQGVKLASHAPGLALQLPVEEGDSGGPVLDGSGRVVGVTSAVRRRVPGTAIGPDVSAIRSLLKLQEPIPEKVGPEDLLRATVWISPTATDRRTAGVLVDARRRWVLTSNQAVGPSDHVGVVFPRIEHGKVSGDRDFYRDTTTLVLAGLWTNGTVIARDSSRDLAVVELDRVPISAVALPLATVDFKLGEPLCATSHPVGLEFVFTLSSGSVRQYGQQRLAREGKKVPVNVLQLPAQAQSAGGPIVNQANEVLGILAATDAPMGIGYSISLAEMRQFLVTVPGTRLISSFRFVITELGSFPAWIVMSASGVDPALSRHPEYLAARLFRAEANFKSEKHADSMTDLDFILTRAPQNRTALLLRAEVSLAIANPKSAQADAQRILGFDPAHVRAHLVSGRAYAAAGEEPKAITAFSSLVRLTPQQLPTALAAIGKHADTLTAKGTGNVENWLGDALSTLAKVVPDSPFARAVSKAPTDATPRTKYLRDLCGDGK